jgi:hypothetical protein
MENASSSHEVMVSGATVSTEQPSLAEALHVTSVQIHVSGKNFLTRVVSSAADPAPESPGGSDSADSFSSALADLIISGAAAIIGIGMSSKM